HYMTGIRDTSTNRANYATALTRALHLYLFNNYGYSLAAYSVSRLAAPPTTKLSRGGAPVSVTVNRTGNLTLSTSLALSFGGTAVLNTDYTVSTTSVSIAANEATKTFTLTPAVSPNSAGDKSILVSLAPTISQAADTAPLTFTLSDGTNQTVHLTAIADSVTEGTGVATFQAERTHTASALTVPLWWSGTALAEADYHSAPASVTFAAGVASVEFSVPVVDDGRAEADKTLIATLANGSGYVLGLPAAASVTIIDDDRPAGLAAWLRGELANNVAFDSSGNNRHATTLPATSSLSAGPTALVLSGGVPAINFDGANDTAALPRFTPDPAGAFTVAFFFRLSTHANSATDQSLLSYGARGSLGSLHVYLTSTTNLRTSIPSAGGALLIDVSLSSPGWQDNVWRHYAISVANDGSVRVYLNGVPRPTATGRTGTLAPNQLFWLGWRAVGGTGSTTNSFMRGALRDFRVYQRALGQAEITALTNEVQNYAAWLAQNNLPANLIGSDDSDADGFPALVEYGVAARPALADLPPRYTVQASNGKLSLTFLRDTAATDATWTVEASTDLATWQPIVQRSGTANQWTILVGGAAVTEQNGYVVVTDSSAPVTGRFLRLRVSL
ncbi:MAG: LamG-like jellyroll fold domain-containing protein, partial [Candidatus Didemnitutus sp.]|nr:LamG-like jellyroll fold domain-containing protein [Candidatus Didemnitutus sp.]